MRFLHNWCFLSQVVLILMIWCSKGGCAGDLVLLHHVTTGFTSHSALDPSRYHWECLWCCTIVHHCIVKQYGRNTVQYGHIIPMKCVSIEQFVTKRKQDCASVCRLRFLCQLTHAHHSPHTRMKAWIKISCAHFCFYSCSFWCLSADR